MSLSEGIQRIAHVFVKRGRNYRIDRKCTHALESMWNYVILSRVTKEDYKYAMEAFQNELDALTSHDD